MKKKIYVKAQLRPISMNLAAIMTSSGEGGSGKSFSSGGGGDPGMAHAKGGYSSVSFDY